MATYHSVIFDMDGTLLDTERVGLYAWQHAAADVGYSLPEALFLRMIGRTPADSQAILLNEFGTDFPYEAARTRRNIHADEYVRANGVALKQGASQLLRELRARKLPLALATSTYRKEAEHRLTLAGIIDVFSVIVCGDEVAHGKPAPDLFLAASIGLKMAASESLVFEDSASGIQAAHAAGCSVIAVPDLIQPPEDILSLCVKVVLSLEEVLPLLDQLFCA